MRIVLFLFLGTVFSFAQVHANDGQVFQGDGIKIGEMTQTTAIVWTRLTSRPDLNLPGIEWPQTRTPDGNSLIPAGKTLADMEGALPGNDGSVRITYWNKDSSAPKRQTEWVAVDSDRDFIHQFKLTELDPGASYQLEVQCQSANETPGPTINGSFRTPPPVDRSSKVSFTVVTGQDYPRRDDPANGHKIYPLMHQLDPDFFVHTGDNEYYDKPGPIATNVAVARFKWNRLYGLPFEREFQNVTGSYFIKDDHDTLKDDAWPGQTYGDLTWEQGLAIFREQFPLDKKNYRTIRWGKELQIWLVEGRDFRSPNNMPDGPDKTIWGEEQKQWFFNTVDASDATFKILLSPTPLVGPDRDNKGDNHANESFSHEGQQLRSFIGQQKNMFVCCGDRHWQYVSVDPDAGVREFSCGPTSDKHAGGWSNDQRSPMHQYLNVVGGFLSVTVEKDAAGKPVAIFRHYSTDGKVLNEDKQVAQ
jgi:alkaline phosphatase D